MNSNPLMAIYLAHWLQHGQMRAVEKEDIAASNELKRLYFKNQALETENATLQSGYNAARLEIVSLQAKLAAGQAKAVPVAVTTDEELAKLSGENAGSKMATMFHPSASGFQVKLYTAPQAQA